VEGPGRGGPAKGRGAGSKYEPFQPGHTLSLRHGAYSPRVVEPLARRLLGEFAEAKPVWIEQVDTAALTAWARAEARCEVLRTGATSTG
jgi:hypothetical protein